MCRMSPRRASIAHGYSAARHARARRRRKQHPRWALRACPPEAPHDDRSDVDDLCGYREMRNATTSSGQEHAGCADAPRQGREAHRGEGRWTVPEVAGSHRRTRLPLRNGGLATSSVGSAPTREPVDESQAAGASRIGPVVPRFTSSGRTSLSPRKVASPRIRPMRDCTAIVEMSPTS